MAQTFSSLLVQDRIVSFLQMDAAVRRREQLGGRLGTALLELNEIDEGVLLYYLSKVRQLPAAEPALFSRVDPDSLRLFPVDEVVRLGAMPLEIRSGSLKLVVCDPLDPALSQELANRTGLHVQQYITLHFRFQQALHRFYGHPLEQRYMRLAERFPMEMGYAQGKEPSATTPTSTHATAAATSQLDDTIPGDQRDDSAEASTPVGGQPAAASEAATPARIPISVAGRAPMQAPEYDPDSDELPGLTWSSQELAAFFFSSESRDQVLLAALGFAGKFLRRRMLLVVGRSALKGFAVQGVPNPTRPMKQLSLPFSDDDAIVRICQGGSYFFGDPDDVGMGAVYDHLGVDAPEDCVLLPITIGPRAALLLAGDRQRDLLDPKTISVLFLLVNQLSAALERLIVLRKSRKAGVAATSMEAAPVRPEPQSRPEVEEAVAEHATRIMAALPNSDAEVRRGIQDIPEDGWDMPDLSELGIDATPIGVPTSINAASDAEIDQLYDEPARGAPASADPSAQTQPASSNPDVVSQVVSNIARDSGWGDSVEADETEAIETGETAAIDVDGADEEPAGEASPADDLLPDDDFDLGITVEDVDEAMDETEAAASDGDRDVTPEADAGHSTLAMSVDSQALAAAHAASVETRSVDSEADASEVDGDDISNNPKLADVDPERLEQLRERRRNRRIMSGVSVVAEAVRPSSAQHDLPSVSISADLLAEMEGPTGDSPGDVEPDEAADAPAEATEDSTEPAEAVSTAVEAAEEPATATEEHAAEAAEEPATATKEHAAEAAEEPATATEEHAAQEPSGTAEQVAEEPSGEAAPSESTAPESAASADDVAPEDHEAEAEAPPSEPEPDAADSVAEEAATEANPGAVPAETTPHGDSYVSSDTLEVPVVPDKIPRGEVPEEVADIVAARVSGANAAVTESNAAQAEASDEAVVAEAAIAAAVGEDSAAEEDASGAVDAAADTDAEAEVASVADAEQASTDATDEASSEAAESSAEADDGEPPLDARTLALAAITRDPRRQEQDEAEDEDPPPKRYSTAPGFAVHPSLGAPAAAFAARKKAESDPAVQSVINPRSNDATSREGSTDPASTEATDPTSTEASTDAAPSEGSADPAPAARPSAGNVAAGTNGMLARRSAGNARVSGAAVALDLDMPGVLVDQEEDERDKRDSIVASDDEGLIIRLIGSNQEDSEAAFVELLDRGADAAPALMSAFPGPLSLDRRAPDTPNRPIEEHGPLIWLIGLQLTAMAPFLADQLRSESADSRYYAALLFSRTYYPAIVPQIAHLVFDADDQVRQLALRVVEAHKNSPDYDRGLKVIRAELRSGDAWSVETAISAVGQLRDDKSVPDLIEQLDHSSDRTAGRATNALTRLTFENFGRDKRKWEKWYRKHGNETRNDWLLEALVHKDRAVRDNAARELRTLPRLVVNYNPDLDKKALQTAQRAVARYLTGRTGQY